MTRRVGLDKERVVQAAVDLIQSEGIAGLTLNRLAERLDVQTPSLYNHIQGLSGLYRELELYNLRMLGDRITNAALGKSGVEAVLAVGQIYRAYVNEFSGLYQANLRVTGNQEVVDPEIQAAEEKIVHVALAVVASLGISGENALHAVRGLRSLAHGFASLEAAGGFGLPLDCDESFRRLLLAFCRGLELGGIYTRPI